MNQHKAFLDKYTAEDSFVESEGVLEELFAALDEVFDQNYMIKMRYHRLYISADEERHIIDVSKIKVENIKNAINTIKKRFDRFNSEQAYDETLTMLLDVFGKEKSDVHFLNAINEQGVEISMITDDDIIGKKLRFCVYGRNYAISGSSMTKIPYKFKPNEIYTALKTGNVTDWFEKDIEIVMSKIFVCDLKTDKIVLLSADNNVLDIIDINKINKRYIRSAKILILRDDCVKILILRSDCSKAEIAGIFERLMSGSNKNLISSSLTTTVVKPNIVLPDYVPYYRRPLLKITAGEFDLLRREVRRICRDKRAKMRDYLAKDTDEKMFGYGGVCSICGFESDYINAFAVKNFEVELISAVDETEQMFKFMIYMCYSDFYASDGWEIEKLSIGGMNPFVWLKEIVTAKEITPEFLHCSLTMSIATQALGSDTVDVHSAAPLDFILSPFMATKWVEDNI